MPEFTQEQVALLESDGNCVVIAKPGSGKTATLARYIQLLLPRLPNHRGVIAISFTRKASAELSSRVKGGIGDVKSSFFGTIDSFYISEIIVPFGRRIFGGKPGQDFIIEKLKDLSIEHELGTDQATLETGDLSKLVPELSRLYVEGVLVMETLGYLAVRVLRHSLACRQYLAARYSLIVIDEYQDCGKWQHAFFLDLAAVGVRAIAVGDLDQSIFGFARKSSEFLSGLARNPAFQLFPLTLNHRCHTSIVNYSTRLITAPYRLQPTEEIRVFGKRVSGSEGDIGAWLSGAIPAVIKHFGVKHPRDVAVLVRRYSTGDLVTTHLTLPHKYVRDSSLDDEISPSGIALRDILRYVFDVSVSRRELVDEYLGTSDRQKVREATDTLVALRDSLQNGFERLPEVRGLFVQVAQILTNSRVPERCLDKLDLVLANEVALQSYIPAQRNEVQVMTIHRSKGLEFDVVFHLDLYQGVFPHPRTRPDEQEVNLHYVALTRARKACFLCCSTVRHDWHNRAIEARPSEFFRRNRVNELAIPSKW